MNGFHRARESIEVEDRENSTRDEFLSGHEENDQSLCSVSRTSQKLRDVVTSAQRQRIVPRAEQAVAVPSQRIVPRAEQAVVGPSQKLLHTSQQCLRLCGHLSASLPGSTSVTPRVRNRSCCDGSINGSGSKKGEWATHIILLSCFQ